MPWLTRKPCGRAICDGLNGRITGKVDAGVEQHDHEDIITQKHKKVDLHQIPARRSNSDGAQCNAFEMRIILTTLTFRSPRSILPMWLLSIKDR